MHILVFPGWYPCRLNKYSGDFVQRHLHAISRYCRVTVFIAVKDSAISKPEQHVIINEGLTEVYHYYPSFSSVKWLEGLLSFTYYNYKCLRFAMALHKKDNVSLVHLCVLQKNHLLGIQLKKLCNIPYVISEHSTFYIDGQFEKLDRVKKRILKYAFDKAASFHAVSKFLYDTIYNKLNLQKQGIIIPNVVDTDLFFYKPEVANDAVTFVHVSNMVHQKNVEGMLEAFSKVKAANKNFLLNLVGPLPGNISGLIRTLGLQYHIQVFGEREYNEVAEIMQQSDAFVFFTRYETFGCVIIEANACGLPVIVSDLPVTGELITDGFNGVFVQNENVNDLADAILKIIEHSDLFDPISISTQTRNKFNYDKVGKQFYNWYTSLT